MADPTPTPPIEATAANTRYVILHRDNSGFWNEVETMIAAVGADAAIRKYLKGAQNPAGTYVAVPQRSWKPVTVSAVQTTVLKLEDAM